MIHRDKYGNILRRIPGSGVMERVGQPIYGYCEGSFGRDFWSDTERPVRVEQHGYDWVVVRNPDTGEAYFQQFESKATMIRLLDKWGINPEEE